MSEFKAEPGRFYKATVRGVPDVVVAFAQDGHWTSSRLIGGWLVHHASVVTDIRPLVVLDLENPRLAAKVMRQVAEFSRAWHQGDVEDSEYADEIASQIEAQTKPPKPPEPTNFAAAVKDADGTAWSRVAVRNGLGHVWVSAEGKRRLYERIDVVKVLSEGVPS